MLHWLAVGAGVRHRPGSGGETNRADSKKLLINAYDMLWIVMVQWLVNGWWFDLVAIVNPSFLREVAWQVEVERPWKGLQCNMTLLVPSSKPRIYCGLWFSAVYTDINPSASASGPQVTDSQTEENVTWTSFICFTQFALPRIDMEGQKGPPEKRKNRQTAHHMKFPW